MRQSENVEVGDMVLVRDDDYPPSQWQIGSVAEVFPDSEGFVRRVMVRTQTSHFMRSIHKVSILPIEWRIPRQIYSFVVNRKVFLFWFLWWDKYWGNECYFFLFLFWWLSLISLWTNYIWVWSQDYVTISHPETHKNEEITAAMFFIVSGSSRRVGSV